MHKDPHERETKLDSAIRFRGGKKRLPTVYVTEQEFVELLLEHNLMVDSFQAKLYANTCKEMGTTVLIGDKLVGIRRDEGREYNAEG